MGEAADKSENSGEHIDGEDDNKEQTQVTEISFKITEGKIQVLLIITGQGMFHFIGKP